MADAGAEAEGYVRIREAAIALFAERGVGAVSVRDIAAAADVSSGLIRHHFGGKDQLREACDDHVLRHTAAVKLRWLERMQADPSFRPTYDETLLRYYRYLGRATMDGSAAAQRHFGALVDATQDWLEHESGHEHADSRAVAAVLTAYGIGSVALLDQIARVLALEPNDPLLMDRVAAAGAAIFTSSLLPPDLTHRLHDYATGEPKERS